MNKRISIRIDKDNHAELQKEASARGYSNVSQFIRFLCKNHELIQLNNAKVVQADMIIRRNNF